MQFHDAIGIPCLYTDLTFWRASRHASSSFVVCARIQHGNSAWFLQWHWKWFCMKETVTFVLSLKCFCHLFVESLLVVSANWPLFFGNYQGLRLGMWMMSCRLRYQSWLANIAQKFWILGEFSCKRRWAVMGGLHSKPQTIIYKDP